jgi:hypothetical protein
MKCLYLLLVLCVFSLRVYAPNELSKRPLEKPIEDKDLFLLDNLLTDLNIHINALLWAQIMQESRANTKAYNLKEDAAGILQIRPVKLRAINRMLKKTGSNLQFTLEDRWDQSKSIQMWYLNMNNSNPNYDVREACLLWNGRGKDGNGSTSYFNEITTYYEKYKLQYNKN